MTREQWKNRKFKQSNIANHHFWDKTEITDKELWSSAFNATANTPNCSNVEVAILWADKALKHWKNTHEINY